MMKLVRNQKGLSIVEVLVAAGLTAVVSLGIATMIQNSMIEQKKTVLLATLRENKIRIEALLRDQNAWTNTIRDATNQAVGTGNQSTACLITSTPCDVIPANAPLKLIVRDGANLEAFNLLTWAGVGSNGFTESGAACDTFSATTGTDRCPISYRLVYMYSCTTGSACVNPQIKIVARLIYNPSTTGVLHRFRGLISAGNMTSIADDDDANLGKYDALVKRTSVETNRQFRLAMRFTGAAGSCATAGFGQCNTGTMGVYPSGRVWQIVEDQHTLVTLVPGDQRLWRFNEAGPYSCSFTAQAFSTGGFSIALYQGASAIATASTTAGQWASSTVVMETKFIASTGVNYSLRNLCQALPGGSPSANLCTLGIAQVYGTPTDFVTANCYKVDKDL